MENDKMEIVITTDLIITLKDIVDVINKGRGVTSKEKGFIKHSYGMGIAKKMTKVPSFGTAQICRTVYNDKSQTIDTYLLTSKQAITRGAKLDNTMLMQVYR